MSHSVGLTVGHLLRHAPSKGGQGFEAAAIDVAQDLLLKHLDERDVIDALAFKGGTAIRKLLAGSAGRFSTDLDFAVRSTSDDPSAVVQLVTDAITGVQCGPFRYGILMRRGKALVTIESDLGKIETLTCKLDLSPAPWLPTERRAWVPMPIHLHYGAALPELNVVQIEENIAEKIARLNRATFARDVYDLVWIMQNRPRLGRALDQSLIRRLAVMKAWVDMHGLRTSMQTWRPAHEPRALDVSRWLRERSVNEFDDEFIGLLASPPPTLDELARALSANYGFLRDLTDDEKQLASCSGRDRTLLLQMLDELPNTNLPHGTCW